MKKQTLFSGAVTLIVVGLIVKILGLLNRVVIARFLGPEAMGIYMLTFPTLLLFITLGQLGFPISISKVVSENTVKNKASNKSIISSALKLSVIISLIINVVILFSAKPIAYFLLKEPRAYYAILSFMFLIPFCSLSSVLKGYFNGLKIIYIPAFAQLIEQIIRITSSIILILYFLQFGVEYAVFGAALAIGIGEFFSFCFLVYTLIREHKFHYLYRNIREIKIDKEVSKNILNTSIPTTGNRLIGSLAYFVEPIIFVYIAANIGFSTQQINIYYGHISGYLLPILFIPSFIVLALCIPLIPSISEKYAIKDYDGIRKQLGSVISFSYIIGLFSSVIITYYSDEILLLFYNDTSASNLLKLFAVPFFIYYFQMPITSSLQAIDKAKVPMFNSLIGNVIKLALMPILIYTPSINLLGFPLAIIISVYFVTILNFIYLKKYLKIKISIDKILLSILLAVLIVLTGLLFHSSFKFNYGFILEIICLAMFYLIILISINYGDINTLLKKIIFRNKK